MRKVLLRMNEENKYSVIKNLVDNNGNKKRAAIKLNCSVRNVNRLILKYKLEGRYGFIHKNRGKKPSITIDKQVVEKIVMLYKTKYMGFNFSHFREYLIDVEKINISYSALYNILTHANIHSPRIQKTTKKRLAKERKAQNIQTEINNIDTLEIEDKSIALEDSHPRGSKSKYFGEITEWDASQHIWFGNEKYTLHKAIDKCTGTILGAHFEKEETLMGYYIVFADVLRNYGIPYKIRTDRRTIFEYESIKKRDIEKDTFTQFSYACNILGVILETTSIPQRKATVERGFGTEQDRLISELRLNNIEDVEEANKYLKEVYISKHNSKFALDYTQFDSLFERGIDEEKINTTLAVISERKIDNGCSVRYNKKFYQLYENGVLKAFRRGEVALIIKCLDGRLIATVGDKIYELRELKEHKKTSMEIDVQENIIKETKKYIPPMSHPWKRKSFENYLKKQRKYLEYIE